EKSVASKQVATICTFCDTHHHMTAETTVQQGISAGRLRRAISENSRLRCGKSSAREMLDDGFRHSLRVQMFRCILLLSSLCRIPQMLVGLRHVLMWFGVVRLQARGLLQVH